MKVACMFDDRAWSQRGEDMLLNSLAHGFVDAFGSTNVRFFPPTNPHYLGSDEYAAEWPVYLGFGCLSGKPLATFSLDESDAYLVNVRWLINSVQDGLQTEAEQREMIKQIDSAKTILIDSSDSPSWERLYVASLKLNGRPHLAHRPNIVNGLNTFDGTGKTDSTQVHISVPQQHVYRMMAKSDIDQCETTNIFCSLNDNSQFRRELMQELVAAYLSHANLRWGSAEKFVIDGTGPPISPPLYYRTMSRSRVCIAARGVNSDTLRQSEILALGSLLISDDCQWEPHLVEGKHYIKCTSPAQFVDSARWAIDNPGDAADIAKQGHEFYMREHTPAQQAVRIIRKAGLLK